MPIYPGLPLKSRRRALFFRAHVRNQFAQHSQPAAAESGVAYTRANFTPKEGDLFSRCATGNPVNFPLLFLGFWGVGQGVLRRDGAYGKGRLWEVLFGGCAFAGSALVFPHGHFGLFAIFLSWNTPLVMKLLGLKPKALGPNFT